MEKETRSEMWDEQFKKNVDGLLYYDSRAFLIDARDRGDDNETLLKLYTKLARRDTAWQSLNNRINVLRYEADRTKMRIARMKDLDFEELDRLLTEFEDRQWAYRAFLYFVFMVFFFCFFMALAEKQCAYRLPL